MKVGIKEYRSLLVKYLGTQKLKVLWLTILLFSSVGFALLSPQIIRWFLDTVTTGGSINTLMWIALAFICVAILEQLVGGLSTYVSEDVGWTSTNHLREDLALHTLKLDMAFHNERTAGEFIERIDGDITAIATFFSQFVIKVVRSSVLLLGILVLLFIEDWRVGLALTVFSFITIFALMRTRNLAVPASTKELQANADLMGFIEERLNGLPDIRANGGGNYTMLRYYQSMRNLFLKARIAWMYRQASWVLMFALLALNTVIGLGMGAWLYYTGAITLGVVYVFFQYSVMLRVPLEELTDELQRFQKATAGIVRVSALLVTQTKIADKPENKLKHLPADGALAVEFSNVTFGYENDEPLFKDLTFHLEPGKILGLVGRTGSGKTTITRLVFRLYDPQSGDVLVNHINVRDIAQDELHHRVGIVTQEVQLFHASVRDNLTFFDSTIPDERILQVIKDLGMQKWYGALTNGLDTQLGASGSGLSAGESQLLAFARIFLKNPGLVILDEPSSRLDPATEALIERAVTKLLENRTVIIIAHRLATVEKADEIMVLDKGRIVEHGERITLANNPTSHFYHLLQAGMEEVLV
jgi:ABC-type multidrug transport system fused ATPase/permease subunit